MCIRCFLAILLFEVDCFSYKIINVKGCEGWKQPFTTDSAYSIYTICFFVKGEG